MVIRSTSQVLKTLDHVADYLPVLSTVTNAVDIAEKHLFFKRDQVGNLANDYVVHILDKSLVRCLLLLVPVIGNLIVAVYDYSKEAALEKIRKEPEALRGLSRYWQENPDIVMEAIKRSGAALQFAAPHFQDDEKYAEAALADINAFLYLSPRLRNQKEWVLPAVERCGLLLAYASQNLRADVDVAAAAVRNSPAAYKFIANYKKGDEDFEQELWAKSGKTLDDVNADLRSELHL